MVPRRPALSAWLAYEQTVNEHILNDRVHTPIDERSNTVATGYRAEARPVWTLDRVLLPASAVREYGFPRQALREALGLAVPPRRALLFVHPQSRELYRDRIGRFGLRPSDLTVTPTASYRSLLAARRGARAAILKVSLDATVGRVHRAVREDQIARGLLVSRLLDTIPAAHRRALRFEWFPERAAVVDAAKRHGWLLRGLPPTLRARGGATLVPAFSLISRRGPEPPLLVELIRRSGERPEAFVARHVLLPYVNALAYLLLEQGLELEGHTQNVLFELDATGALTGKIALRDLSDASVNLALRLAKDRPLPPLRRGFLPRGAGFSFVANAATFSIEKKRPRILRAVDVVDRYGLHSFVWAINWSLRRFFTDYAAPAVETAYLRLWQQAAVGYLAVKPLFREQPRGLAMDEAIAHFLEHRDWSGLVSARACALPATAEPLLIKRRARRRPGRVYQRVDSPWGALYLEGGLPAFFRPAY